MKQVREKIPWIHYYALVLYADDERLLVLYALVVGTMFNVFRLSTFVVHLIVFQFKTNTHS